MVTEFVRSLLGQWAHHGDYSSGFPFFLLEVIRWVLFGADFCFGPAPPHNNRVTVLLQFVTDLQNSTHDNPRYLLAALGDVVLTEAINHNG